MTRLRYQSFDNRLEDELQVGTPISQSLLEEQWDKQNQRKFLCCVFGQAIGCGVKNIQNI